MHNREEKYDVKLPWWQHFWISATFLDRDGPFSIVQRWKKRMGYRFVPECNHVHESQTCQFFSAIFAGPQFVGIQTFCYHGNVT